MYYETFTRLPDSSVLNLPEPYLATLRLHTRRWNRIHTNINDSGMLDEELADGNPESGDKIKAVSFAHNSSGIIIGSGILFENTNNRNIHYWIDQLYVLPQSRRNGTGAGIFGTILDTAASLGIENVYATPAYEFLRRSLKDRFGFNEHSGRRLIKRM